MNMKSVFVVTHGDALRLGPPEAANYSSGPWKETVRGQARHPRRSFRRLAPPMNMKSVFVVTHGDALRLGPPEAANYSSGPWKETVRGLASHPRSEEHTSELQSRENLVCRLLLEKKKTT